MSKSLNRIAGILVIALLIVTVITCIISTNALTVAKTYNGPLDVYKEMNVEKGKPPGTPGGGPPEKPPEEPEPNPSVNKWAVVIGISDYYRGEEQ